MRVIITGGGTGGHLSVARAFLEEFTNRGYSCAFVGSQKGQDKAYFSQDDRFIKKDFLDTSGVVNARGFRIFKTLWLQFRAFLGALRILRGFQADFVLSVGGYSAAPAAFAAVFLRIPLVIHEQNAKIGRLNKLLKPYARIFFSSYLESSPVRFYPTSKIFFTKARVRQEVKTLLFMGGSQGAKSLNSFALTIAQELKNKKLKAFHQCGIADFKRVSLEYIEQGLNIGILENSTEDNDIDEIQREAQKMGKGGIKILKFHKNLCLEDFIDLDVVVFGFSKEMPTILNICDFAICRAGASSLWELCANGLPALFVPYPYAASNHQYHNAKFIEQKGLGFLCLEQDLFCDILWDCLELLSDKIAQTSENLQQECAIDATSQMCDEIIKSITKKG